MSKRSSDSALKWYYNNKEKVLEKRKQRPKIYCKYCDRSVYEDRYESHKESSFHNKCKETYYERKTLKDIVEMYEDLKVKYKELKLKYEKK